MLPRRREPLRRGRRRATLFLPSAGTPLPAVSTLVPLFLPSAGTPLLAVSTLVPLFLPSAGTPPPAVSTLVPSNPSARHTDGPWTQFQRMSSGPPLPLLRSSVAADAMRCDAVRSSAAPITSH